MTENGFGFSSGIEVSAKTEAKTRANSIKWRKSEDLALIGFLGDMNLYFFKFDFGIKTLSFSGKKKKKSRFLRLFN